KRADEIKRALQEMSHGDPIMLPEGITYTTIGEPPPPPASPAATAADVGKEKSPRVSPCVNCGGVLTETACTGSSPGQLMVNYRCFACGNAETKTWDWDPAGDQWVEAKAIIETHIGWDGLRDKNDPRNWDQAKSWRDRAIEDPML